jgi:hypothetical protein
MSAKAEIGWKHRTPEGGRREVYVRHVGDQWRFFERARRFEPWQELADPPLEDWLELLDAAERLVPRRRLRPEEPARIRQQICERYPEAPV